MHRNSLDGHTAEDTSSRPIMVGPGGGEIDKARWCKFV